MLFIEIVAVVILEIATRVPYKNVTDVLLFIPDQQFTYNH